MPVPITWSVAGCSTATDALHLRRRSNSAQIGEELGKT